LEPKLPLEVTCGDVIRMPLAAVNGTAADLSSAAVTFAGPKGITIAPVDPFTLKAHERQRRLVDVRPDAYTGTADLVLSAASGDYADKVTRPLVVRPQGFPVELALGGMLGPSATITRQIEVPQTLVPRSLSASVAVYPTPLANMTEALQRLMQEPYGCFEQ